MRSKWTPPDSLEEVQEKWGPVTYRMAREWGFGEEDARDIQAMVVEEFAIGAPQEDGSRLSYLNIYDPERGAFSTFWFAFSVKRIKREHSKRQRDPLFQAFSLDWTGDDGSQEERFVNVPAIDPERQIQVKTELRHMVEALRRIPPKASKRGPNGRFRTRSLSVLFNMIVSGWTRTRMAAYWGVTEGTISHMIQELREVSEVKNFQRLVEANRRRD